MRTAPGPSPGGLRQPSGGARRRGAPARVQESGLFCWGTGRTTFPPTRRTAAHTRPCSQPAAGSAARVAQAACGPRRGESGCARRACKAFACRCCSASAPPPLGARRHAQRLMRPGGGGGEAAAARAEASAARARKQIRSWIRRVLQPSPHAWGGWGVARPSAFCEAGPDFLQQCAAVMSDRGGEGSWKWKKLPPGAVTQGAPRAAGGAAGERGAGARPPGRAAAAETAREAAAREAAERRRAAKARERQRLAAERAAFKAELRAGGGGGWESVLARAAARPGAAPLPPPPLADTAAARAQAVAAYARVKAQRAAATQRR